MADIGIHSEEEFRECFGLRDALKVLDKEGNGMVSSAELRHIVANLKVKTEKIGDEMVHTPIGDEELDEAMEEIDPKKAGQIKIDHLVKEVFKKARFPPRRPSYPVSRRRSLHPRLTRSPLQVYIPPLGSVSYLEDRPKRQSLSEMMM